VPGDDLPHHMNQIRPTRNRVSEMNDDLLIDAVARGDHAALRELFDRHAPWVAARLRRTLPRDGVEDVLQETFIAVWRGAGRYKGDGAGGAWLWGIARRQAALWARKQGRPEGVLDTSTEEDPASRVARTVDVQQALTTLGAAGDDQRELVRLIFIEDRPIADVAALLGIPSGTVKSRVYKVRRLLQAALRQGGY